MICRIDPAEANHLYPHRRVGRKRYPRLDAEKKGKCQRQNTKEYGAVFLIGIVHAYRQTGMMTAPDYDDWTTETENGYKGLWGYS